MQSLCLVSAPFSPKPSLSPVICHSRYGMSCFFDRSTDLIVSREVHSFNPLRFSGDQCQGFGLTVQKKKKNRRGGAVCYSAITPSPRTLQWISTVSTAILMLVKGTAINKSYLVPLFALQAPESVVTWIQGEYGAWSAFLTLLVRMFFFIPGELELPFLTLLFVIVAPYQALKLRGSQPGTIISIVIASYLAFQHFSRAGSLEKAFSQGAIVATLAIIAIVAVPFLLLI